MPPFKKREREKEGGRERERERGTDGNRALKGSPLGFQQVKRLSNLQRAAFSKPGGQFTPSSQSLFIRLFGGVT